jgi:hypothetical protein
VADLTVLTLAGLTAVLSGLGLLLALPRRGRHTTSGALPDQAWAAHLPAPDPDLSRTDTALIPAVDGPDAPTELIPAVPARPGRHWFAATAQDIRHTPAHDVDTIGWRLVPAGWTPPIGAARIHAALDDTQLQARTEVDR